MTTRSIKASVAGHGPRVARGLVQALDFWNCTRKHQRLNNLKMLPLEREENSFKTSAMSCWRFHITRGLLSRIFSDFYAPGCSYTPSTLQRKPQTIRICVTSSLIPVGISTRIRTVWTCAWHVLLFQEVYRRIGIISFPLPEKQLRPKNPDP